MTTPKIPESNITRDIIQKIHLSLANLKTGQEILEFLKETEPIFMEEVTRFVQAEMYRLKFYFPESQALYLGSVIGAAYIAGFLIARESSHQLYNGLIKINSPINNILSKDKIDKMIDKLRREGKSYNEIGKAIRTHLNLDPPRHKPTRRIKKTTKKKRRLDIDKLGL